MGRLRAYEIGHGDHKTKPRNTRVEVALHNFFLRAVSCVRKTGRKKGSLEKVTTSNKIRKRIVYPESGRC